MKDGDQIVTLKTIKECLRYVQQHLLTGAVTR
jgi:hypothetical protein